MLYRASRGTIGVQRLLGADEPIGRYKNINVTGAFLGPSFGAAQDIVKSFGAIASGDASESDVRAFRRLVPFQNLFYIAALLRRLEQGAIDELNIPRSKRRSDRELR